MYVLAPSSVTHSHALQCHTHTRALTPGGREAIGAGRRHLSLQRRVRPGERSEQAVLELGEVPAGLEAVDELLCAFVSGNGDREVSDDVGGLYGWTDSQGEGVGPCTTQPPTHPALHSPPKHGDPVEAPEGEIPPHVFLGAAE